MGRKPLAFSLLLLFLALLAGADAPGVYALVGGTVHPVSGADIPNGTVIIRGGLIERVGANVAIPADATVIDVKGLHVYPGMIDAQTSIGLPAAPRPQSGPPSQRRQEADPNRPEPAPSLIAARIFKPSDEVLEGKRATGVTTVLAAPPSGIFNGQTVVVNLAGDTPQTMLVKTPATLQISFNPRSDGSYPDSLMGVISYIRQTLLDAQQYREATSIYQRNPAGKLRPAPNPDLEALQPVLRGEIPVVFIAESELMMRRVAEIAREFNLRAIVSGARQAYRAGDFLKSSNLPVFFSVNFPKAPTGKEEREIQPLRAVRDRVLSPSGAAELAKRNVRFAIVSNGASAGDYIRGIRRTVEAGLSEADALRAVTLTPAQILAVDKQLGSLDAGKIANVFVTDKKFYEKDAKVKHLFIDGRIVRLPRDEEKKDDETPSSPLDGSWNVVVRGTEGDIAMQFTLKVQEGRITGTYSGDRGSGDLRDGSLEGTSFQFTITARSSATGGETSDWRFAGTLSDGGIEGTVTTTVGTFQFSGSKPQ